MTWRHIFVYDAWTTKPVWRGSTRWTIFKIFWRHYCWPAIFNLSRGLAWIAVGWTFFNEKGFSPLDYIEIGWSLTNPLRKSLIILPQISINAREIFAFLILITSNMTRSFSVTIVFDLCKELTTLVAIRRGNNVSKNHPEISLVIIRFHYWRVITGLGYISSWCYMNLSITVLLCLPKRWVILCKLNTCLRYHRNIALFKVVTKWLLVSLPPLSKIWIWFLALSFR